MDVFITRLSEGLARPLPGREAQFRMAIMARRSYAPAPEDARKAAVLALFFPRNEEWHIALIQRSAANPNDRHSGQISFPGGSFDHTDEDLLHTALREAEEEVNVPANSVHVLGALTSLYIPVSNFEVFPFVGYTTSAPDFKPEPGEVQSIIEAPFRIFQDASFEKTTEIHLGEHLILRDVPCFLINGHIVWGATAMIMSELLACLPA
jgi:8-oxo-dGTP pyrophosphatase MutT (NUDIX family)